MVAADRRQQPTQHHKLGPDFALGVFAPPRKRLEGVEKLLGGREAGRRAEHALSAPRHVHAAEQVALGVLQDLVRTGRIFQRGDGHRRYDAAQLYEVVLELGVVCDQRTRGLPSPQPHLESMQTREVAIRGTARKTARVAVYLLVQFAKQSID